MKYVSPDFVDHTKKVLYSEEGARDIKYPRLVIITENVGAYVKMMIGAYGAAQAGIRETDYPEAYASNPTNNRRLGSALLALTLLGSIGFAGPVIATAVSAVELPNIPSLNPSDLQLSTYHG